MPHASCGGGGTSKEEEEAGDNDCMICLFPLLGHDDEQHKTASTCSEIGAVFPCGHVFHIHCWRQWNKDKCPVCNQVASLFSKIFIKTPTTASMALKTGELEDPERLELERYRRRERDEKQASRMLLRDMEKQLEQDPAAAKTMMTMMMMVHSRDLRKAERALQKSQEECASKDELLQVVQKDLQDSLNELATVQPKADSLQRQVTQLKKESARAQKNQEYKQQVTELQANLDRAKEKLAIKNKQLTRRNKELASKRKLLQDHKIIELAANSSNGSSHGKGQRDSIHQKTLDELQRTKKELELLRELDSFTMGDESYTTYGHGSFNDSLSWNDLAS
ncbi:expressed unknown protein [Seminavis robusta]|uniref:RING-type domain-containing protein n=1 Tax=Seminavis robusta TaxID=568900 RepID=A0A9N8D5M8_9STRA|nr:expressed unknown protein [Seminavis robusta]|eukprot:Sro6_g005250.1 n/a (336) ;mRNA; f:133662-134669